MKEITGACDRILEVDLTERRFSLVTVSAADRRLYLGGKGLGVKYCFDRIKPGTDPLGEDNVLAFMMGVLLGTGAPCSGRFAVVTKSPLTGLMVSSSCGGPFGTALKTAGYEGLLIRGRASAPVYLQIDAEGAAFADATGLWGLDTVQTQKAVVHDRACAAVVIGPAGENRVRFANIASGHRFLGRGGIGAVMGAKNLKAVVAKGRDFTIVPKNPARFQKLKAKAERYINANHFTADRFRRFGTNANTLPGNTAGILPVCNFRQGSHPDAHKVSGEALAERYRTIARTCKPCTILCGHMGRFPDGGRHQIPEYETVGLLGLSLGVFDTDAISRWNEICGRMGMDTISAGGTLAWAMEAGEKGLYPTALRFGSVQGVDEALAAMAGRSGAGDEMANGVRWLSERYGGKDFAMHVKGLEMAAYDPRGAWGQGLAYAVANRGACHLSAYVVGLEVLVGVLRPFTTLAKPRFVRFLESVACGINALQTCQFTMFAYMLESPLTKYTPKPLLALLMQYLPVVAIPLTDVSLYAGLWSAVTGTRLFPWEFLKAGDRINVLERWFNTREGIRRKDDTLPERLTSQARADDPLGRTVPLHLMLDRYYRLRGYDANGVPTANTLVDLGIMPKTEERIGNARLQLVTPSQRCLKRAYVGLMLWFMGRAMAAAAKVDREIHQEVARLPEGFCFALSVAPAGPCMLMGKDAAGRLRFLGTRAAHHKVDLHLQIKNIEAAFRMFSFQESTAVAVTRNRLILDGDTACGCTVVRVFNAVEVYLLPKLLARLAVKRYPAWSLARKCLGRIQIYLRAVIGV
jgi:aldehyde:ferredoxin oxidoreductase